MPIKSLWYYPVRGVRGIKANELEIRPFGIKNDRLWVIIDEKKLKPVANHNSHLITFLRQIIRADKPDEVKLILQDTKCYPHLTKRSHTLQINKDHSKSEFIEGAKNYRGYKECDEVNEWLSEILHEEVILIRAEPNRLMKLDEKAPYLINRKEDDRRANFLTDGVIHLINNQSMQALIMHMYNKYAEDGELLSLANADIPTFRPNIVIDEEYDEPYCEDEF